jgi:hypothetical protein
MSDRSQPLVLDYLTTHTLDDLKAEHAVNHRFSADGRKVSLNYDTITSKPGNRLAEECRGLVLGVPKAGEASGYTLLAWPLSRFYNAGDPAAAPVDWNDPELRVWEKLDGTMIVVYHDGEKWCAGTRAVPEADVPIHGDHLEIGETTFADLFWQTMAQQDDHWLPLRPDSRVIDPDLTLVFELTSPYNRVVVQYDQPRLTLLAARHRVTGKEFDLGRQLVFWPRPKSYALRDAAAVAAFVSASDPLALEGAVVVDSQFRRVKVKSAAWIALSSGKVAVLASRRAGLLAVLLGKLDDVLPLLGSARAATLVQMQTDLAAWCACTDAVFAVWRDESPDRKAFAQRVMAGAVWPALYFQLLDKRGPNALSLLTAQAEAGKLSESALDAILDQLAPAALTERRSFPLPRIGDPHE